MEVKAVSSDEKSTRLKVFQAEAISKEQFYIQFDWKNKIGGFRPKTEDKQVPATYSELEPPSTESSLVNLWFDLWVGSQFARDRWASRPCSDQMKDLQSLVDLPVLSWKFWESDWQLQRIRRCSSTLCRYKGTKEECIARTGTLPVERIQAQSDHSSNPNSCWCVRSMLPTGPQVLKV